MADWLAMWRLIGVRQAAEAAVPGSNQASMYHHDPDAMQDHCEIQYNLWVEREREVKKIFK